MSTNLKGTDHAELTNDTTIISANRVEGTDVYDKSGENIGSIEDVMIDRMSGKVRYAIMSFGGFLGIGEKYHPLPWDSLDYDVNKGGYCVEVTKRGLEDAPNFNRDAFKKDRWATDTDRYYNDRDRSSWLGRSAAQSGVHSTYG